MQASLGGLVFRDGYTMLDETIYSTKEACAQQRNPDTNYANLLLVEPDPGKQEMSYIGFDISSAPAEVSSVRLYLYRIDDRVFDPITVNIYRVTDSWAADTLTWNNRPSSTSVNGISDVKLPGREAWRDYDITDLYKDAKADGDDLSVHIAEHNSGDYKGPYNQLQAGVAYLLIEFEVPELTLSNIATIGRYGSKFYLQGEIRNIVEADEICLMYSRPLSADLLNLPSSIVGYTYLKGTAGTYSLESGAKYIEFSASGYYIFELWRVSGTCETRTEKVAEYFLNLEAPKYQYQLYFDLDAAEISLYRHLLQAEYDKYEAAKPWTVVPEKPDCFSQIEPSALYPGGTFGSGWLCQAVEYGKSPCAPLPYWLCSVSSPETIYMRGECSCSDFLTNLQPLGIPCMHLIAAMAHYGNSPPYCPYIQCS